MNKLLINTRGTRLLATDKDACGDVTIQVDDCLGTAYLYLNKAGAAQLISHLNDCFDDEPVSPKRISKVRAFMAVLAVGAIIDAAILYSLL